MQWDVTIYSPISVRWRSRQQTTGTKQLCMYVCILSIKGTNRNKYNALDNFSLATVPVPLPTRIAHLFPREELILRVFEIIIIFNSPKALEKHIKFELSAP